MTLVDAIPALPVRNIGVSAGFYREKLGFAVVYEETGFAVLKRDSVVLHLWAANDDGWRKRVGSPPVVSGAETFLAGTASCRIRVAGLDALHAELSPRGVLHGNGALTKQWWGDRDFSVVDIDSNLLTFFEPG